jgi:predicted neuraminidase
LLKVNRNTGRINALLAAWLTAATVPALAGNPQENQGVGAVELLTFDARPLTLENYSLWRATVVLFLSTRSPESDCAIDVINELNTRFRLREVLFVGVFPNPMEEGEEIRRYAQRRGFMFPFYRDPEGRAARKLGARVTPEAFLLDRRGALVYDGAVGAADTDSLGRALASLVAGEIVTDRHDPPVGDPIGQPGVAARIPDPYGSIWYSSELIFETIEGAPAHHCSTMAEAANGDLLALWYGGSFESSDDQALFLSRRPKGEREWDSQVLIRDSLRPPGNAVIFRDGLDRIWIVWGRMESARPIRRGSGWSECRLMYRISTDHGRTWEDDRILHDALGTLPRNVPIHLRDGTLLLPLSGRIDGHSGSFFLITGNHGATWERSSVISGGSQPTVVEREDGTLLALMRGRPRSLQSESRDGGRTWSPAVPSDLRNPGSGVAMTALGGDRIVAVFNDSETGRSPLSIARSGDGGRTWEEPLHLESNPGEYSYPSLIRGSDGRIHVSYTYRRYSIKHVELSESWLEHLRRPN